jgi:hypothetical protein
VTAAPPTGVLVITFWADGSADELRLKVVSTTDVIAGVEHRFVSTEPKEVLEYVRSWLSETGDAIVTAARRSPVSVVRQGLTEAGGNPEREGE